MKNRIIYLIIFALVITGLSGCDDDSTGGVTGITYYPTLELLGESEVIVAIGSDYQDAGVHSELLGEDVTDQVITESDVDTSTGGVYSVNYKIQNEDGYFVSTSRTVYVADVTPSIIETGMHTTLTGTHRYWFSTGATVSFSGYDILILQVEPGVFYISDFMGGYYDQRAGYGANYAMTGYFQLNEDNTLTPISSSVAGWGDSMDAMTSSSVDPATGQINYVIEYAGAMEFTIILN